MGSFLGNVFMGDDSASRKILQPLLSFGFRFYVAYVFFKSGLTKVDDKFQVTQYTKDLFAYDYNIPLLPSDIAAYLATYAELTLPILLVLGLFTRKAAIALLILNVVAANSLTQADVASAVGSAVGHWQHVAWGSMLAMIVAYGPSKISIDSWIADRFREKDTNLLLKLVGIIVLSGVGYFLFNKYL